MQQCENRADNTEYVKKCGRRECDRRRPDTGKDDLRRAPVALA